MPSSCNWRAREVRCGASRKGYIMNRFLIKEAWFLYLLAAVIGAGLAW